MTEKIDYILVMEHVLEHASVTMYLDLKGLGTTTEVEKAQGFATIEEAEEARSKLNVRWRCGAVIKRRSIPDPNVKVSAVW